MKFMRLNGLPVQVWEGKTSRGTPVHVFVAVVAPIAGRASFEYEQFDRDMRVHAAPSPSVAALPKELTVELEDDSGDTQKS